MVWTDLTVLNGRIEKKIIKGDALLQLVLDDPMLAIGRDGISIYHSSGLPLVN